MKSKNVLMLLASGILVVLGIIFIGLTMQEEKSNLENITAEPTTEETTTQAELSFKIEDRTNMCAQSIETFYEDDNYLYQYNCIKSGSVYVVFNDGTEYSVKNALRLNKVTIEELDRAGAGFNKVPKAV